MPTKLSELASRAQDLFYQDYAPRTGFFDEEDFKFHAASYYNQILNSLYQVERRANKAEDGFSNIELPASWLISEIITLKEDDDPSQKRQVAGTKLPIFSFNFDGTSNALQGVHSVGSPHVVYRKISLNERKFKQIMPVISKVLFFVNSPTEIVFWGATVGAKIEAQYVPAVSADNDNCLLADALVSEVIKGTLTLMFGAKNGNVIQEANDGNKNGIIQNQVDPKLSKAQTE